MMSILEQWKKYLQNDYHLLAKTSGPTKYILSETDTSLYTGCNVKHSMYMYLLSITLTLHVVSLISSFKVQLYLVGWGLRTNLKFKDIMVTCTSAETYIWHKATEGGHKVGIKNWGVERYIW